MDSGSAAETAGGAEYQQLLEQSKALSYEEFEKLDVLYISGRDPVGRPIVIFIANRLPAKSIDMEKFLLYCIHKLDSVVRNDYVLVYVGANTSSANRPSVSWLRRAYGLFSRNYKKHIQKLYLIHPTTFTRLLLKVFKPFVSEKFWRKLVQVEDVKQVHQYISPDQLRLPDACYDTPLRKGQTTVLFGATLVRAAADNPHPSGLPAPLLPIFTHLSREPQLSAEGLFRVSGSEAVMRQLRTELERGATIDWATQDVHAAAGVLKQFVRELRIPTLPPSIFAPLAAAVERGTDKEFARDAAEALGAESVPAAHRALAGHLFTLLALVAEGSERNKMTAQNLAVCLAPHLLRSETASPASALKDISTQTAITARLIKCWSMIIEADPELAADL